MRHPSGQESFVGSSFGNIGNVMTANNSSLLHKNVFSEKYTPLKISRIMFVLPYIFGFKLPRKQVIQRVRFSFLKETTEFLVITELK